MQGDRDFSQWEVLELEDPWDMFLFKGIIPILGVPNIADPKAGDGRNILGHLTLKWSLLTRPALLTHFEGIGKRHKSFGRLLVGLQA